jgi:hypothetical protein
MPTPFSHLAFAQRLRDDSTVPSTLRGLIETEWSAFLLGSVAADGHILEGVGREVTHFYAYDRPMEDHPWRVMVNQYPALMNAETTADRAFVAGYVGHLSMDEIWSLHMLHPHFADREWAPRAQRFLMLHILLIYMDERDLAVLPNEMANQLRAAQPESWLPFLGDEMLIQWRDLIYRQIKPGGTSETLEIFGQRIHQTPEQLRSILDSPERMQNDLWIHISPALLHEIEEQMYSHAREQMMEYLNEAMR